MTIAYVYKWTHIPSLRWYVGSRVATGCHPDDGYLCHSKDVKPMIIEFPTQWKREIIDTGSQEDMYQLETDILRLFDAKNDPMSFNKHNNDGIYVSWGNKHPNKNPINARKISVGLKDVPKSKTHIDNMSKALRELGDDHPSKQKCVRDSKRKKMLAKGELHHQKTDEARSAAKNRVMGNKNPMYGKEPLHKIKNITTPLGKFENVALAAEAHRISQRTMLRWISSDDEKYKEYYK